MLIDTSRYLNVALKVSARDRELGEYATALLPDRVVDSHSHVNLATHVRTLPPSVRGHIMSTFPHYSLDQASLVRRHLWPDRTVYSLRMPNAYNGIDHRSANDYLLGQCFGTPDRVAAYGLPDNLEYTIALIQDSRVSALKMYHRYFEPPARHIYDYFPFPVLEEACARSLPVLVHLPTELNSCLGEVVQMLHDFPRLRVVLAHAAMAETASSRSAAALTLLSRHEEVYLDTALVMEPALLELSLRKFGTHRVLYGSDEPLSLIRGLYTHHPTLGPRVWSDSGYHWQDPEEPNFDDRAPQTTLLHHLQMRALLDAIENVTPRSERSDVARRVFAENATGVYGF